MDVEEWDYWGSKNSNDGFLGFLSPLVKGSDELETSMGALTGTLSFAKDRDVQSAGSAMMSVGTLVASLPMPPATQIVGGILGAAGAVMSTLGPGGGESNESAKRQKVYDSLSNINSKVGELAEGVQQVDDKINEILQLQKKMYKYEVLGGEVLEKIESRYMQLSTYVQNALKDPSLIDSAINQAKSADADLGYTSYAKGAMSPTRLKKYLEFVNGTEAGDVAAAQVFKSFIVARFKLFWVIWTATIYIDGKVSLNAVSHATRLQQHMKQYVSVASSFFSEDSRSSLNLTIAEAAQQINATRLTKDLQEKILNQSRNLVTWKVDDLIKEAKAIEFRREEIQGSNQLFFGEIKTVMVKFDNVSKRDQWMRHPAWKPIILLWGEARDMSHYFEVSSDGALQNSGVQSALMAKFHEPEAIMNDCDLSKRLDAPTAHKAGGKRRSSKTRRRSSRDSAKRTKVSNLQISAAPGIGSRAWRSPPRRMQIFSSDISRMEHPGQRSSAGRIRGGGSVKVASEWQLARKELLQANPDAPPFSVGFVMNGRIRKIEFIREKTGSATKKASRAIQKVTFKFSSKRYAREFALHEYNSKYVLDMNVSDDLYFYIQLSSKAPLVAFLMRLCK